MNAITRVGPVRRTASPRHGEQGQALAIALVVLLFLTVIIGTTALTLRAEGRLTRVHADAVRARYLAQAGVERAVYELAHDRNQYDALNERWSENPGAFGWVVLGQEGSASARSGREHPFYDVRYISPDGTPRLGIVDEERKLNINKADENVLRALIAAVCKEKRLAIPEGAAKVIHDRAQAKPFRAVGELAGLKEVGPEVAQALVPFVTVYGAGAVNVNTAEFVVLAALEGLGPEGAREIIARRNGADGTPGTLDDQPFRRTEEVRDFLKLSRADFNRLARQIAVRSEYFTIEAYGVLPEAIPPVERMLSVVVWRKADGIQFVRFEER